MYLIAPRTTIHLEDKEMLYIADTIACQEPGIYKKTKEVNV